MPRIYKSTLAASVLLAAMASAGLATCPTQADLDGGIRLTMVQGETEVLTRLDPLRANSVYQSEGGYETHALLARGLYVLQLVEFENGDLVAGSRSTHSYELEPQDMPLPVPGGQWVTKSASLDADGLTTAVEIYRFGAETRVTWGACGYTMIPVTISYPDDTSTDLLHWLPELGVSYLAGYTDDEGEAFFDVLAIEAVQ